MRDMLRVVLRSAVFVLFVLSAGSLMTIVVSATFGHAPAVRLLVAGVGVSTLFVLLGLLSIGLGLLGPDAEGTSH